MKTKFYILIFFFGMILVPQINYAQVDFNKTPDDDLGDVEDRTQELFFEALKQQAIENYDRAVKALLLCIELDKKESVFYFELGKNYNKLKNFGAAEDALKRAVKLEPENEWYLDELYTVYAQQNDEKKAIKTIQQLVKYHPEYKEDLAMLYFKAKKYNDALSILDELDKEQGITPSRDLMRNQIYKATGRKNDQIQNLETRVDNNPDEESNYLALIYRYSENNDNEKAFETAKKLLEIKPNSQLVHLALYKFYIEENSTEQAIASMKIVLQSPQINPDAKMMVLSDFVKFVSENPEYEQDLVEATSFTLDDTNDKSYIELAQYYLRKDDKEKALKYYNEALKIDSDNYSVLKQVLLLDIDLEHYEEVVSKSDKALLKYPSQPLLYLVNGVALNRLNKPKQAIDALETGLDYVIDDTKMEGDFYRQLSLAYSALNNTTKAKTFSDKAEQLESTN
ncbi:tetratricopeptide repeat protein [Xanthomarina sp. F1114]|uniref:tetratricopeptide repeat protein n=1 Tax=Xanthomarina sp. F1114 TaxID=2996019 RepID=UPI00225E4ECC|nr:tetratricopeptide repeat protein [Xanthomarina sp. F1114]MCX7548825.1 tetratricopeptide repeat protein [Xanthomarina sp. F1114]